MSDALIRYWLPKSRVRVTGQVAYAWSVDWDGLGIRFISVPTNDVTFYAVADTSNSGRATVRLEKSSSSDLDTSISLHPDGRISSFTGKRVDQLDAILGNVGKVVGAIGVTALAIANPAAAAAAVAAVGAITEVSDAATPEIRTLARQEVPSFDDSTPEQRAYAIWAAGFPQDAARGQDLHANLRAIDTSLTGSLVDLVTGLATNAEPISVVLEGVAPSPPLTPEATSTAVKAWTELRSARDTLAEDLAAIEASIKVWASQQITGPASFEFTANVTDIAAREALSHTLSAADDADTYNSDELSVRLVRVDPQLDDAKQVDDTDLSKTNDVRIRLARPVTIGVYIPITHAAAQSQGSEWVLVRTLDIAVVDGQSRVAAIPLRASGGTRSLRLGSSGDRTVTIATGADGITTSVGIVQGSPMKEWSQAAAGLVAGLGDGAELAKKGLTSIADAQTAAGKISAAPLERRIADLEIEKKLIDAELALASAVSARTINEKRALVAARLEHLKSLRDFGVTAGAIAASSNPTTTVAGSD